ncbi:MAG: 2,3-bisphosphoglycerate-independent phosphoglycerate mutase [Acidobacteriota bacterium]
MERLELYRQLAQPATTRILYYVIDGLGGLPFSAGGPTELETAHTPTLDQLARQGSTGLITPVLAGIAPGSGPAHLALFGFDPTETTVGRGVLAALGIGFELRPGDVAARINFCTLDGEGKVVDRRAGRIDSPEGAPLAERLDGMELAPGVDCMVRHVKQYRACLILRGSGLDGRIADTDPQVTGEPARQPQPLHPDADSTASLVASFIDRARLLLADQSRANGVLLRGFDSYQPLPSLDELYGIRAAAVAAYPMYRGVARAVGMRVVEVDDDPRSLARAASRALEDHDFIYVHYKTTDSRGEDGDFDAKVGEIEQADHLANQLLENSFDVVMVTGDHSTPALLARHSWHPVPLLLWGGGCRAAAGASESFGEKACLHGALGQLQSTDVLPLVLAQAGRLAKFGA